MKPSGHDILSIGDGVTVGRYRLHSRFSRAVNYTDGIRVVTLATQAGPDRLVFHSVEGLSGAELQVTPVSVDWGSGPVSRAAIPVYISSLPGKLGVTGLPEANLAIAERVLEREAPPESIAGAGARDAAPGSGFRGTLHERYAAGIAALRRGDYGKCAEILRGIGPGLTPAGDDFIAGMFWAFHLAEAVTGRDFSAERTRIRPPVDSGNLIVRAFLENARRGRFDRTVRTVLIRLARGSADRTAAALRELMAAGATSGADSAAGMLMTLRGLLNSGRIVPGSNPG